MKFLVCLITILGVSLSAKAGLLLDMGGTYIADSISTSSTKNSTKYLYNVAVLFSFNKDIWGGWSYLGLSQNDSATGSTTNYNSMDTGPTLKWLFGKNHLFSLSGTVNLISRATYTTTGAANEKWEGMSYWASFGLMPEVSEGFHLGASLNYFMASYTKKTVSNTESSASNSKSWIFPMISLTKTW